MQPASTDTPRLFVPDDLAEGFSPATTPGQAHYLGTVLRRVPGDPVRLFNGRDGEWEAHITALKKDRLTLTATRLLRPQVEEPDFWLLFAPLKRDATDILVQKATELGASALLPVRTARTNSERTNLARLTAIATEAAEQSERLTVPALHGPRPLADILGAWAADRPLFAALERSEAPSPRPQKTPAALLIGPEGGFSPLERDLLAACPFVTAISLGPRVLRAETAAIAGLALLLTPGCG